MDNRGDATPIQKVFSQDLRLTTQDFLQKTAFITGGTGFVGSHLVEVLLAKGYEVRCLVRKELGWLKNLPITPIYGDLFDPKVIEAGVSGADVVFHVGGLTRSKHWDDFVQANMVATTNLLDGCLPHAAHLARVVVVSSQAASGASETPLTEDAPMKPLSMYGKSKSQMEETVHSYMDKLPITIIRPPSVYGAREADIFTLIQTMQRGICPIIGNGKTPQLNLVYVKDLVQGMMQVANTPKAIGQTYFLGSAKDYTWHEIRDAVCVALGKKALTIHIPKVLVQPMGAMIETMGNLLGKYPPFNREKALEATHSWRLSIAKAQQHCGYAPSTPLEQGMKETVAWYKANGWL